MSCVHEAASPPSEAVPERRDHRARLIGVAPIVVVAGAFLITVVTVIALRTPLGHDESVYMLRGRDIGELGWSQTSGEYWLDYRAPGSSIMVAALAKVIGLQVSTSRALVAVLATAMVVLTWAIGRRLARDRVGVVAAVLLALVTGFVSTASTVLADVPGAAFALAAVWLYAVDVQRGRLRSSLFVIPVLTLIACVSRFGAPFMLGAGFVGVSLVVLPEVVRARNWVLAGQAFVLGIVVAIICWVVLFTEFVSIGGRTPVEANRTLIEGKQLSASTGFRDLWAVVNPWSDSRVQLWTKPVALAMAVGVLAAILAAVLGRVSRSFVVGVGTAAVLSTVGITASVGLIVNNYLALTLPYWVLLAGVGLVWLGELIASAVRTDAVRPVLIGLAIVVAGWLLLEAGSDARALATSSTRSFEPIRAASVDLGAAFDHRCVAVTSYAPQVGYYSECVVTTFSNDLDRPIDQMLAQRLGPLDRYLADGYQPVVFLVDQGKRQPPQDAFESSAVGQSRLFEYSVGDGPRATAWVQLVEPCVSERNC